jgi:CubicO group peptidase (beta-lactamase class C family)
LNEQTWDKFYDSALGEFPYADKITIRQMLSMTSGIPEYITKGQGYDPEVKTAPYNWTSEVSKTALILPFLTDARLNHSYRTRSD